MQKAVTLFLAILALLPLPAASRTAIEQRLGNAGYIDVATITPRVAVDLMYARPDNFTGRVLYDSLTHAYLHPDAARALSRAARELSRLRPGLRLLVKDAARPVSVQRRMFATVRGTAQAPYVANPDRGGGTHNFGIAVDVTLCDTLGRELSLGTPVDYLGPESHIDRENRLLSSHAITAEQLALRRLLRRVMTAAGFKTIRKEWWHFELQRREVARTRYRLIDF